MLNIKILAQLKNYTLIQDTITSNIYLYSYKELIACYDGKLNTKKDLTNMSKMHINWFKEFMHNKLI